MSKAINHSIFREWKIEGSIFSKNAALTKQRIEEALIAAGEIINATMEVRITEINPLHEPPHRPKKK